MSDVQRPRPEAIDYPRRPFIASAAEFMLYEAAVTRWETLDDDSVLTEAARLFNLAVHLVGKRS